MPTHVQIRNVPEVVHRRLKARAAQRGQSLSEYLLGEIERIAELPTLEEVLARIASREPVDDPDIDPVAVIRAARGE
jgi:hypothetical protein